MNGKAEFGEEIRMLELSIRMLSWALQGNNTYWLKSLEMANSIHSD